MGFFSDVVHRITHTGQQINDFHHNAADQVTGDVETVANNNDHLVATIDSNNRRFFRNPYRAIGDDGQSLFTQGRDFLFFQNQFGKNLRNNIRTNVTHPVKKWWDHWGHEIHVVVNKWGGEQKVVGWVVVVVCIIVIIYTWGAATPYVMAICGPMMSYGVAAGLAPSAAELGGNVSVKNDNSRYNAQNDIQGGAGSGQSPAGGVADFLAGHPFAVVGAVLAAAGIGLFFLLRR